MSSTLRRLRTAAFAAAAIALALGTGTALAGSGVGGIFNLGVTNTVDLRTYLVGTSEGPQLKVENKATPGNTFGVLGVLSAASAGTDSAAVRGQNLATNASGYGVWGSHAGAGAGVYGTSGDGKGVYGKHTSAAGAEPGVQGETASPSSAGVFGKNTGGGPGLQATVNAGVAPIVVNSSTLVSKLNADFLDGFDSADLQRRVTGTCPAGSAIQVVNANGTVTCQATGGSGSSWSLTGNAGTTAGSNFIGTTDDQPFEVKVNGQRAVRIEPYSCSPCAPSIVEGDVSNNAGIPGAAIGGGINNVVGSSGGTIGGGRGNVIEFGDGENTIGGGGGNHAAGNVSTVGGGLANSASGDWSTVGGGAYNTAGYVNATVAGGNGNKAYGSNPTVGGGSANSATGDFATVAGGGFDNSLLSGPGNTASGDYASIVGGKVNTASGDNASIGGGRSNSAAGMDATIAGGQSNTAGTSANADGNRATIGGGSFNSANGNWSTVPGGGSNSAGGGFSFAAGYRAKANSVGAFVWGDSTTADVTAPAANTFTVRAKGGIWLGTTSSPSIPSGRFLNTSTGAYLSSAGTWTNNSDRALKHDFRPLSANSVLRRVGRMPIESWSYKAEKSSVRHVGPTAQDFYKAFGLGLDDRHIATIDEGGVALAAIKGLYRQNLALQKRVATLERTVARLSKSR